MTVSLGAVIWSSVKPIIKIYLIIGVGFLCAKLEIVSAESIKSISNIVLTVLLPCLSFNKIVSSIEDKDIKDVGIICLSAALIFGTGMFFAFVCSKFLPVPKEWRGGILAGGMFPNISDLPIAYLQTLDQGLIFTEEEGEKGIASVIIFLTMFLLCVFNLGGFRLIEYDFTYNDEENAVHDSDRNSNSLGVPSNPKKEIDNLSASPKGLVNTKNKIKFNLNLLRIRKKNQSDLSIPDIKNNNVSSAESSTISMLSTGSGSNSRFTVISPMPIPEEGPTLQFNETELINKQIRRGLQNDISNNASNMSSINSYDDDLNDSTSDRELSSSKIILGTDSSELDLGVENSKNERNDDKTENDSINQSDSDNTTSIASTALSPTQTWGNFSTRTSIASEEAISNALPYRISSQPIAFTSALSDEQHNIAIRRHSDATTSMNQLIRSYSNVDQYGNYVERRQSIADSQADSINTMSSFQRFKSADLTRMVTTDVNVTSKDVKESGSSLPESIRKLPFVPLTIFFLKNCLRPASMAVIIALICAFIPWVKALFVTTDTTPYIPNAPDLKPPLSFIIDFTGYVGAASVPFGLLLLGATLGRLSVGELYPGFWKTASLLVILRQCVMPIFGVLWCDRLVKAGWVNWEDDRMLLFVIAITWSLPTMTTLIYFTASYTSPDVEKPVQMECVSFFLMIQYPLLVVSLPFLVTYFLKVQLKI
ncbi:hypothetical protein TPHA_0F01580 [Tetrapisispora phaffii CBS 4417]|uniref:Transporter n=1 Tax=Tetrapisispora phaffii (strain ATCC 24235 / CBS 4417 / NBRC 1672 / NRRL Y-8282 / UCD 70-5) TaxID=1071381 RepID=G8BV60_TETPH|nr:hypothetical protein TPHA_0F01580 [Tetrapisispora phaffii CBS 4417]CCE63642.1 hypothetical protein TPHA_0F01580 [Tetrapisispora phaffii CBS 4417]